MNLRIPCALFLSVLCLCLSAGAATRAVFDGPPVILSIEGPISGVRAADFNHDGKADFAELVRSPAYLTMELRVHLGNGDGTFGPPVVTPVPWYSTWFDVGDVNGDNVPDLAFARRVDTFDSRVNVYLGTGDGAFTAFAEKSVPEYCWASSVALADVTGDGRPDIVTCNVTVFPNTGSGFGSAISTSSSYGGELYVVDVNGDGRNDVVQQRGGYPETTVLFGAGNGSFPTVLHLEAAGESVAADFDGNGRKDFAWLDEWKGDLGVRLASAAGAYDTRLSGGLAYGGVITAADLNHDGRPDIIVGTGGHVYTWITNPDGSPGTFAGYVCGSSATSIAAADFDGDGFVDLAVAGDSGPWDAPGAISVMRNAGDGTLRAPRAQLLWWRDASGQARGSSPDGVALSDVTGDGKLDAVVMTENDISVFPGAGNGSLGAAIHTTASVSPPPGGAFADIDDDGRIDVIGSSSNDVTCWLANSDGTYRNASSVPKVHYDVKVTVGDFNGDGNPDILQLPYSGSIALNPGRGDGQFDAPITSPFTRSDSFLVGDVNNDGRDDVVFSDVIFLGSAAGTFSLLEYEQYFDYAPKALVDLNDDGNLDVVKYDRFVTTATMMIRLGHGDGTFEPQVRTVVDQRGSINPFTLGIPGDFNADGKTDLAFDHTVLLGDGTGSFAGYERLRTSGEVSYEAAGDLDGNGSDDLVFVSLWSDTLDVVPTWRTNSQEHPLTVSFVPQNTTPTAGEEVHIEATTTGEGCFAPTGGIVFRLNGVMHSMAETIGGRSEGQIIVGMPGSQQITASFGGDVIYAPAEAPATTIEVSKTHATVSFILPTPVYTTAVLHVKGSVLGNFWEPAPTGVVTVTLDGAVAGQGTAPNFDVAVGQLSPGPHTVIVDYPGDVYHLAATKQTSFTAVKPPAPIVLSINPTTTVNAGADVIMTATFTDPAIQTGTVKFIAGGTVRGEVAIDGGVATFTMNGLTPGFQYLYATYAGDATYAFGSKSKPITVVDVPMDSSATSLYLVTPCRVIDTRAPIGPGGGPSLSEDRSVQIANVCGIPFGAKAVALTITVVSPGDAGYLTVFPAASPRPVASTINYRAGRTRANNAVLPLSAGGVLRLHREGNSVVNFIIDVTGYFQ